MTTSPSNDFRALSLNEPRFAGFSISTTTFKTVLGSDGKQHFIDAYIMVPKSASAPATARKVLVKFHGGFFVTGAALYPEWFAGWLLEYALEQDAVIVAPNYRLIPEATAADILEDVIDFWRWLADSAEAGLQAHVSTAHPGVALDLSRVVAVGESAGGQLALLSALEVGRCGEGDGGAAGYPGSSFSGLRAVIAQYPAMDIEGFGTRPEVGEFPPVVYEEHLRTLPDGHIVSEIFPTARMGLAFSLVQNKAFPQFFGDEKRMWLLKRVAEPRAVTSAPYQLILHGADDPIVPVKGSYLYHKAANAAWGEGVVDIIVQPGGHGFDIEASLSSEWLRTALKKITALWRD
ncbi:hypothetical protein HK405_011335 [Cladochytrium tenue]|nr:hypothetical protein HK405_011335 [Cladochytrium tenue]